MQYYLCFKVKKIPDLTLVKYSVYDISGQEDLIDKHRVFLRQLHRLGVELEVFFHLLYYYNSDDSLSKGKHLQILFYATSKERSNLELIREFVVTSVLSTYYDFYCYEVADSLDYSIEDGYLYVNASACQKVYKMDASKMEEKYNEIQGRIEKDGHLFYEIAPNGNEVTEINGGSLSLSNEGKILYSSSFKHGAFLTKKDYHLFAQNRLYNDPSNELVPIYSIMEWVPNSLGRLYNVLKLMEGYNETAAVRIDLFPTDMAESFSDEMTPIVAELRQRMSQHGQGKDENCGVILKSIEDMAKKLMKYPQFYANVVAFSDSRDIAIMLADSVGAEAVESGSYLVNELGDSTVAKESYDVYSFDDRIVSIPNSVQSNCMFRYVSLYTLDEVRPMFSFPVLYLGETIECAKETDPAFSTETKKHILLGESKTGYDVNFPVKLFKKHAFVSGVPGSGKTNTMLNMVSELWNTHDVPFLVFEPAKQEYRALFKLSLLKGYEKLKEICIFSPGADTKFPLHINPFEFPKGLTLAEHIANLNAVFEGAFELPPPSPHFIDSCIEQVYKNKGWNVNARNTGKLPYPTMQELYDSLNVAVQKSHYQGETLGNLRSVMEVRVGSLLKREIGNVYNVEESSLAPEKWLEKPVIVELEALGEGPSNFMVLLISTLIRETLKVRKTQGNKTKKDAGVNHIIFYEEAHNLIGPTQENVGDKVNPKVSSTKFLVKMLAEVRALDEGIVIADQLPTAMAPQVLKNTGLKIGHRITSIDDRKLLGSTMFASDDQLEEQGTYVPGEALVFYEGLLKPFKMKMEKWQFPLEEYSRLATNETYEFLRGYYDAQNITNEDIKNYYANIYDSPTDDELYSIVQKYPEYSEMKKKSGAIIYKKMDAAFRDLYVKLYVVEADMRRKKQGFNEDYNLLIDLNDAFQDGNQLLFNNLCIAQNYENKETMVANAIDYYLSMFERVALEHLCDNRVLNQIWETVNVAYDEISKYLNITDKTESGVFLNTEDCSKLVERSFIIEQLRGAMVFGKLREKAKKCVCSQNLFVDETGLQEVAEEYGKEYFQWMKQSEKYGEHTKEMQLFVIESYLQLFECFKYAKDASKAAFCIVDEVKAVRDNISSYISWSGTETKGSLAGEKRYSQLVEKCVSFAKLDIYDVFSKKVKPEEAVIRNSLGEDYKSIAKTQIKDLFQAYMGFFHESWEICKLLYNPDGESIIWKEAIVESIDLFYGLFTKIGIHFDGQNKKYLWESCEDILQAIAATREKHLSKYEKEEWKKVDEFLKD